DYEGLRVIAVDDRSTDGTRERLRDLAESDDRLEVVAIDALPDGWLGKTNALHQGAGRARSDWLLFTDADVRFDPSALRRLIAFADRESADHVVVGPDDPAPETRSAGERMFLALFGMLLILGREPWRLANPRSRAFLGIGAGNLVRRSAFLEIGGFEPIRLSVDDDLRLGQALKWSGYRQRFAAGRDCIAVRWQEGVWGMLRGIEKNAFAAMDFNPLGPFLGLLCAWVLCVAPLAGLAFGDWIVRAISLVGLLACFGWFRMIERSTRIPPVFALTLPLGLGLVWFAVIRSMVLTLRRGGVVWRGTLYSLALLKGHIRERRRWMRARWRARSETSVAEEHERARM
ncbi:MAG: glycosyltransferase family 2 protein, partial [Planctomycetota bacterium]